MIILTMGIGTCQIYVMKKMKIMESDQQPQKGKLYRRRFLTGLGTSLQNLIP